LDLLTVFITIRAYQCNPKCKAAGKRDSIPGRRRIWHA
jgi:hypothetical protein